MRKRIAWFVVLTIIVCGTWGSRIYFMARMAEWQRIANERDTLSALARVAAQHTSDDIWTDMRQAHAIEEWERILTERVSTLEGEDAKLASGVANGKLFEARFWAAEYFLVGAGRLLQYDVNHPAAKKYLDRARELYEKNEQIANTLQEERGNTEWNAHLNYLKGVYYFRSLLFVKDPAKEQSKVEELVSQSAGHLAKVFAWLPKDNGAEVALEVLQKKAKEILSASNSNEYLRLQLKLLPSREVSPDFAIGGGKEGKH